MLSNDIFNILDKYYTELSKTGYKTYYDVYNIFILLEIHKIMTDVNIKKLITKEIYDELIKCIVYLENNSEIIKITRPYNIVIPII